jgi:hypothetical protein
MRGKRVRAASWSWLALTSLGAMPLVAQTASPYVPMDHWAMPYVEYLISTGVIVDPTPLTRPIRQSDVLRALEAADTNRTGGATAATVRRLREEFRPHVAGSRYRVALGAGLAAASYSVRDPLELDRGVPPRQAMRRGFARGSGELLFAFGSFVAVTHPTVDTRLQYDPDWKTSENNATRWEEGYVSGQWRYGDAFFGILDRNWGPSGIQGVLLSDNPYSMDHLHLSIGTERARLAAIVTQLDPIDTGGGAMVNRYQIYHRLWIRPGGPRGRWTVALWEASVLSGVGRTLDPWYLNVATLSALRQGTGPNANSFMGFEVERHARTTLFGQFMLDDIQLANKTATDRKPASYAFTAGGKGRLSRALAWTLFYTQVANLTYRNENDQQVPLYHSLGTGRNFSDYDQATAKATWLARPGLLLEPEVTVVRQGEGDPRLPHPLPPAYPATPTLFQGVVQRVVRFAVGGSWQHHGLSVTGSGGVHLIHNAGHVAGASQTRWLGSLGISYQLAWERALP